MRNWFRVTVTGDRVVVEPPSDHRSQPAAYLDHRIMHAQLQLHFNFLQFGPYAFGNRFTFDGERPISARSTVVRETQEVKRLRLAQTSFGSSFGRISAELDESRFVGV